MRSRRMVVLFWLAGMLFPVAWLGRFSPAYRGVFDRVFGPEWTHVAMHLLLYAVLGWLILLVLGRRQGKMSYLPLLAGLIAVGFLQETFQWTSQGVEPWKGVALAASVYDLVVDMAGGLAGMGMKIVWDQVWANYRLS